MNLGCNGTTGTLIYHPYERLRIGFSSGVPFGGPGLLTNGGSVAGVITVHSNSDGVLVQDGYSSIIRKQRVKIWDVAYILPFAGGFYEMILTSAVSR